MEDPTFRTPTGIIVPAVSAQQMRAVDRVAVEDVGLELLQMMENAGRTVAGHVRSVADGPVSIVAGNGGNGGGGLVCARHLVNADVEVELVLDREPEELSGAAAHQYRILDEMDVSTSVGFTEGGITVDATVIVDALIGYGLDGPVRESGRRLIEAVNGLDVRVVSLDVPSGIDATTGAVMGAAIAPDRTVTLALPKTGLVDRSEPLSLADISIPATVYERVGIEYATPFGGKAMIELRQ